MMDGENTEQSSPETVAPSVVEGASQVADTVEQQLETPEQPKTNGYEGSNFVEFMPDQQKRLNQLSKKAGKAERDANEWRSVAQQQFDLINELRSGQQQIVSHLQTTNYADAENQIMTQQETAFQNGDLKTYNILNNKLIDLRVQKAITEKAPKSEVKVQQQHAPIDMVEAAVQKGAISRDDATVYQEWANETDHFGNLVRPWINERDTRNQAAAAEGQAVFRNPAMTNKPFAEKLKEIDRRMGIQNQKTNGSAVLPTGNLTANVKSSNIKLSPWAEDLAVKTKFAGNGKSRADHIEAYRKQMAEVKGARR